MATHSCILAWRIPGTVEPGGLPFPSPGDLPHPGIKPVSLASLALAGRFFTTRATWEPLLGLCQARNPSLLSGVLGTGLPGLGTEHLPGALYSGTGSPALGLCSP